MLGFLVLGKHTEEGNNIELKDGLSARVYNKIQFIQMSYEKLVSLDIFPLVMR